MINSGYEGVGASALGVEVPVWGRVRFGAADSVPLIRRRRFGAGQFGTGHFGARTIRCQNFFF